MVKTKVNAPDRLRGLDDDLRQAQEEDEMNLKRVQKQIDEARKDIWASARGV